MARKRPSLASILKKDQQEENNKGESDLSLVPEIDRSVSGPVDQEPMIEIRSTEKEEREGGLISTEMSREVEQRYVTKPRETYGDGAQELATEAAKPVVRRVKKNRLGSYHTDVPKSHYQKISITIPPEMFFDLEDLSRLRRRSKEPFSMSDLVREALAQWLPKQKV